MDLSRMGAVDLERSGQILVTLRTNLQRFGDWKIVRMEVGKPNVLPLKWGIRKSIKSEEWPSFESSLGLETVEVDGLPFRPDLTSKICPATFISALLHTSLWAYPQRFSLKTELCLQFLLNSSLPSLSAVILVSFFSSSKTVNHRTHRGMILLNAVIVCKPDCLDLQFSFFSLCELGQVILAICNFTSTLIKWKSWFLPDKFRRHEQKLVYLFASLSFLNKLQKEIQADSIFLVVSDLFSF